MTALRNMSLASFLINENCRAVMCSYEPVDTPKCSPQMFKTFDQTIKKGDYVIIPTDTRHKMTVFLVTDTDVQVDFTSDRRVDYIVGRVDRAEYDRLVARDVEVVSIVRQSDEQARRRELLAQLQQAAPSIMDSGLARIGVDMQINIDKGLEI